MVERRTFLKGLAAGTATTTLAGCLGGGDGDRSTIDVLLTYFPDMVFSPVLAADEFGYFEEVGLDVNVDFTLSDTQLQQVAQGEYDIVFDNPPAFLTGVAQGIPLELTHTIIGQPPLSYASMGDSGIESFEDWAGTTVGIQNEPDRRWFTPRVLEEVGVDPDSFDQTTVGFEIQNVVQGSVDVMSLYPTNSDFASLNLAGEEFNLFEARDYLNVPGNCSITTESFLENNRENVTEFVRAHARGMQDALDESMEDEMIDLVLDALNDADADVFVGDVDPREVQSENFQRFLSYRPIDAWETNGLGWSDPEAYQNTLDAGLSVGEIDQSADLDIDDLINNELVNEVTDDNGDLDW